VEHQHLDEWVGSKMDISFARGVEISGELLLLGFLSLDTREGEQLAVHPGVDVEDQGLSSLPLSSPLFFLKRI
jgi:hypothetical protein